MARAAPPSRFNEHSLIWALGLSVIAHALLGLWLHPFEFEQQLPQPPLTIEIVKQEPPPPPPVPETPPPEQPKPEPPKPKPKPEPVKPPVPKPKPIEQPAPAKVEEAPVPPEPPREETPPLPVITAAPKPEAPPPTFTAPLPPPEPPKPTGPSEADLDAARQAYGNSLSRELAKHKRYPSIARMRGWQGNVTLVLEIDSNGKVTAVRIEEPSDRDVFNIEAQDMVKRMMQPPPIPEALRGRSFTVRVPISFRLE
jgi:protein TonB